MSTKYEYTFPALVAKERRRIETLHAAQTTLHGAYAVILEEVEEFWDEVKKKAELRDRENMLKELVQIAASCQRTAESLGLLT